jgi:hypothetical protein
MSIGKSSVNLLENLPVRLNYLLVSNVNPVICYNIQRVWEEDKKSISGRTYGERDCIAQRENSAETPLPL